MCLVVAGLVASVLSGNSWLLGLPIPPDRILLATGVLLTLLTTPPPWTGLLRWRAVHGLMLATVAWTVWSAVTHQTLSTPYGFYALLDRLVVPFGLFVLAPVLFASAESRRVLLKALVGLGIYLGLTAIFEVVGPTALVFPRYIMNPDVGILFGRARGPFVAAEANGMVLSACLFASCLAASLFRGLWRAAAVIAVPLTAVGVLLALTRSVWIGVGLAMVALFVLAPRIRRPIGLMATSAAAVLAGLLLLLPAFRALLGERLTAERSVFDRQNTNAAALRAIEENPVEGVGWARFLFEAVDWVRQADTYPVTNVEIEIHNVVLSRAAELGLVGAALWLGCVLAGPGIAALRIPSTTDLTGWRLVFVGYASVWAVCIMLSPVPYVLPNYLFWLLAGLVLSDYLVQPPLTAPTTPANAAPSGADRPSSR